MHIRTMSNSHLAISNGIFFTKKLLLQNENLNTFPRCLLKAISEYKFWLVLPNPNVKKNKKRKKIRISYIFTEKIVPQAFLIFWKGAQFDLLPKFVRYLKHSQPQPYNKKIYIFLKFFFSYMLGWMFAKRKVSYTPLYFGMTAD